MAWDWADSFDLYNSDSDYFPYYWDSGLPFFVYNGSGRFPGSQAMSSSGTGVYLTKASNVNDAVHHIVVALIETTTLGGTLSGMYFTLLDGTTAQCTVVFRSDGSVALQSGALGGAVLAASPPLATVQNTWYAFEFEVVINSVTGSFAVRKNGNPVNDFTATALNTRGGTANNYANKLSIGYGGGIGSNIDDFYWRSGASSVAWLGDIRCYTRMPVSDASVQWSKTPANILAQGSPTVGSSASSAANIIWATNIVAPISGALTSLTFNFASALSSGRVRMAIYDNTGVGGIPGALIAQSAELTNPGVTGLTTFSITGVSVQKGATYWLAIWANAAVNGNYGAAVTTYWLGSTYTGTFPSTGVGFANNGPTQGVCSIGMNIVVYNAGCVGEAPVDYYTTYVFDNNPGDADFYNIAAISATPAVIYAVNTRAYAIKSDAGTRTMNAQIKSGGTIVGSPTLVLTTSNWLWTWRMDTVDPNTGAAWTPGAVNGLQVGPKVIA